MSGDLRFSVSLDDLPQAEDEKKPEGAWDFVGGRPSVLPGDEIEVARAAPEAEPGIEVEIVREDPRRGRDDDPDVEALRAEYEATKARAEAAEQTKAAYDAAILAAHHRDTIAHEFHKESARIQDAQRRYANASYEGDHGALGEIAAEIAARTAYRKELENGHEVISQQAVLPAQRPVSDPFQQFDAAIAAFSESDQRWLREHKNDLATSKERQQLAQAGHDTATLRHGLTPGSDEYYNYLDSHMGYDEPSPQPRQSRKQGGASSSRRPMAAPASRSSGRSPAGMTYLNEFDLKTARELGIDPRTYAKQYKSQASKNQLSRADAGGRLHASYSVNYDDHY